tara:strand:- start:1973 stop:2245 length:273 start_codon:yes stop_codon:yes gene_type:complete
MHRLSRLTSDLKNLTPLFCDFSAQSHLFLQVFTEIPVRIALIISQKNKHPIVHGQNVVKESFLFIVRLKTHESTLVILKQVCLSLTFHFP